MKQKKQKEYTTEAGKNARQVNKTAKQAKMARVKQILDSMGYDCTIYYTRKERRKFTRAVNKQLFIKPKSVHLTDEEIKVRFQREKERKAELLENRPHINKVKAAVFDLLKKNKKLQSNEQETNDFRYVVTRESEDNPIKDVDFYTDYLKAKDKEEALSKVKDIAKKYEAKDEKFNGMKLIDLSNGNSIFYPKSTLLAA